MNLHVSPNKHIKAMLLKYLHVEEPVEMVAQDAE